MISLICDCSGSRKMMSSVKKFRALRSFYRNGDAESLHRPFFISHRILPRTDEGLAKYSALWAKPIVALVSLKSYQYPSCTFSHIFSLPVCSYGTLSGQMVISPWCTAPACGSLTGATPSSPSSTLMTACCSSRVSTWDHTTRHQEKSLSSV